MKSNQLVASTTSALTAAQKTEIVNQHNTLRRQTAKGLTLNKAGVNEPPASNMQTMVCVCVCV
jgi:hypothetical protein